MDKPKRVWYNTIRAYPYARDYWRLVKRLHGSAERFRIEDSLTWELSRRFGDPEYRQRPENIACWRRYLAVFVKELRRMKRNRLTPSTIPIY